MYKHNGHATLKCMIMIIMQCNLGLGYFDNEFHDNRTKENHNTGNMI